MQNRAETEEKPAYHHGDLRTQLLHVVRELVEEGGAENFSIAEAARKAGVSSAAPYRHFKDKPEILKAVVLEAMNDMAREMHQAVSAFPRGSIGAIDALGLHYINFARNHPGMFRLVFGISESHSGDEELASQGANVFGIVISAVAAHLGMSAENPEAKRRAYLLWSFVHGHSWLMIDGKAQQQGIDYPVEELLSQMSKGILSKTD